MEKDYQPPELFSHKISSGDKLYGMMFKPKNMVVGRKYPVMLSVYGGPEVQLVTNTFKVFFILFKFMWKMGNSSKIIHLHVVSYAHIYREYGKYAATYWRPRDTL